MHSTAYLHFVEAIFPAPFAASEPLPSVQRLLSRYQSGRGSCARKRAGEKLHTVFKRWRLQSVYANVKFS